MVQDPTDNRHRMSLIDMLRAPRAPVDATLRAALAEEREIGRRIAATARSVTVAVILLSLPFLYRAPVMAFPMALLLGLVVTDVLRRRLARRGRGAPGEGDVGRHEIWLMAIDLVILLFLTVLPNPFASENMPAALTYSAGKFSLFYILLALSTLIYSSRSILVMGLMISGAWLTGAGLIAVFGHRNADLAAALAPVFASYPRLSSLIDPNSVHLDQRLQEVVAFLIVAALLSLKSWRSEQLIVRQVELAAERANLSHYFSPNMVDVLAGRRDGLGTVRTAEVAVLFADIVGFTRLAESLPPERTVEVLRRYYAAIEAVVFDHHGTLDKYLGDGVMATFGTPEPGPQDARNAIRAARQIVAAIEAVNAAEPDPALHVAVSVGVHFGTVTLGNVGPARRLEFAVLGDTVNVASRLEAATRALGCRILCSDAVMARAVGDAALDGFIHRPAMALRGRGAAMDVWSYGTAAPPAAASSPPASADPLSQASQAMPARPLGTPQTSR